MKTIGIFLVTVFAVFAIRASAEENPLKSAKVGDWVEQKATAGFDGNTQGNVESLTRHKVIAEDETSVTVTIDSKTMNPKLPPSKTITKKIPLDQPYKSLNDFTALALEKKEKLKEDLNITILEGDEKITIAGKECDVHWICMKNEKDGGSQKLWTAKEPQCAAVYGIVRMENKSPGRWQTVEVTKFGNEQ